MPGVGGALVGKFWKVAKNQARYDAAHTSLAVGGAGAGAVVFSNPHTFAQKWKARL